MSTKIITDSTCDLPKHLIDDYGIIELPLTVHFGDSEYRDRVDITPEQFFEKLSESRTLPTTSQVSPSVFADVYKRELENGNDVISIHIASDLSGTYQSAVLAKKTLGDDSRISIVDSRTASMALGFVVLKAAQLLKKGVSRDEVLQDVENYKSRVKLFLVVDTLEYLKKGGRLSGTQAALGSMFNIKPILTINEEGKVVLLDKVRGEKKALKRLVEIVKETRRSMSGCVLGVAHAKNPEKVVELEKMAIEEFGDIKFIEGDVGSVVATHAGPGAYGIIID